MASGPLFDRSFPDVKGRKRQTLETALIDEFKRQCQSDSALRQVASDPNALSALAQHHGLPTRLLDWSDGPYVSAFFAYQHALHAFGSTIDTLQGDAAAIWIIDTTHYLWSERFGVQIVTPPAWDNPRMRNQGGVFPLSKTPHRSLQEYVKASSQRMLRVLFASLCFRSRKPQQRSRT